MKKIVFLTFVALILPAAVILLIGCVKPPEKNKDFGNEVSPEAINSAINNVELQAMKDTFFNMKKNDEISYDNYYQINNGYPTVIKQVARKIVDITQDANKTNFRISNELVEYDPTTGPQKPIKDETNLCLELKSDGYYECQSTSNPIVSQNLGVKSIMSRLVSKSSVNSKLLSVKSTDSKLKFYNLSVKNIKTKNPTQAATCGLDNQGQPKPCSETISAVQITFDMVDWSDNENPIKAEFLKIYSSEVPYIYYKQLPDSYKPYFGILMADCFSTTEAVGSQRVAYKNCNSLVDYRIGN